MPRHTTYMLRWSQERQSYEMTGGLLDIEIPQPTSPEWLAWLSGISRSRRGKKIPQLSYS